MHEIVPRGRGGKVSRTNSIAVCGQLVGTEECCHTYLQQSEIAVGVTEYGAESQLWFEPMTPRAASWMAIELGHVLASPVMVETEISA